MALPTEYQNFIHVSRYARWLEDEMRRETWDETVDRYMDYVDGALKEHNNYELPRSLKQEIRDAIYNTEIMPSMRAMMTAGPALERDSVCSYNCSYLPVDSLRSFDEAMYILMCGTGVGYSVEAKYVSQLPVVNEHFEKSDTVITVADSKSGWARALRELLALLWQGQIPQIDISKVRPAGARLKTFGGRASGPQPLVDLFSFAIETVRNAAGRKLTTLEAHDLMCKIADVVVVGGVRRSAMIALSDLNDRDMATAKSGEWYKTHPHRRLANISAVYEQKPSMTVFMEEWANIYNSHSGERGIFSREAARKLAEKTGRRDPNHEWGTNPCSEIILRPFGFCNLTEVVVKEGDTILSLRRKVELAAILGTIQASFTRFKYLRKIWQKNAEEEALLGVSLTGQMGHPFFGGSGDLQELEDALTELKQYAVDANREMANAIGINPSASVTCVKPSGTVSQLVNSASGMHAWHSKFYTRTVRQDNKDPLTEFMKEMGIPNEPDVMAPENTTVFSFPVKAPEGAITRDDMTALRHLDVWLAYQRGWCEHKPSVTINLKEHEWMDVGAWVYRHIDELSGISFLPYDGGTYKQAPYQAMTREEYERAAAAMPSVDWTLLSAYEFEDTTSGSQDLACVAGNCELVGSAKESEPELEMV